MPGDSSQDPTGTSPNVAEVAEPCPGVTLSQYVEYFKAKGEPSVLSQDGSHAWVPAGKGALYRIPLECTEPVPPATVRQLLRLPRVRLVSYLLEGSAARPANTFDYVCTDPNYCVEGLNTNARRDIRRGQRNFKIRLCTCDELAGKGFPAHADTMARHGYAAPDPRGFPGYAEQFRNSPQYELWGAWKDDDLCAWMGILKIANFAMVSVCRSRTAALKWCPNNALLYEGTRRLLVEEKRAYVTYGLSSIQIDADELAMHKYKTRMGYEPVPLRLVFDVRPLLRPLLKWRVMSWMWEKVAKLRPSSAFLRKLAGVSRILSGREKQPLAWAQEG